jgi:nitrate/nitrite transporter NarK
VPQFGLPKDGFGGAAAGLAAGVGSLGVVVAEIAFQIQAQASLFGNEVASEGGFPALLQDGLLDPLDTAVAIAGRELPGRLSHPRGSVRQR